VASDFTRIAVIANVCIAADLIVILAGSHKQHRAGHAQRVAACMNHTSPPDRRACVLFTYGKRPAGVYWRVTVLTSTIRASIFFWMSGATFS
jgi:hypothetical protein